jgi:hypothetical protein
MSLCVIFWFEVPNIVKIPGGSYWKYSQMWASINSWLAFLATFTVYVQEEKLITKSKVRKI